jgi:hypothetical protein
MAPDESGWRVGDRAGWPSARLGLSCAAISSALTTVWRWIGLAPAKSPSERAQSQLVHSCAKHGARMKTASPLRDTDFAGPTNCPLRWKAARTCVNARILFLQATLWSGRDKDRTLSSQLPTLAFRDPCLEPYRPTPRWRCSPLSSYLSRLSPYAPAEHCISLCLPSRFAHSAWPAQPPPGRPCDQQAGSGRSTLTPQ